MIDVNGNRMFDAGWMRPVAVGVLLLAGWACQPESAQDDASVVTKLESGDEKETPRCAEWRWVAEADAGGFVAPSEWPPVDLAASIRAQQCRERDEDGEWEPVSCEVPGRTAENTGLDRPKKLERLESFRRIARPRNGDSGEITEARGYARLDPDCLALTSASTSTLGEPGLVAEVAPLMHQVFMNHVGELPKARDGDYPSVRLVVLDTLQTGDVDESNGRENPLTSASNSSHGHALANIARRLLCPENCACSTAVGSELALRYLTFDRALEGVPDPVRGGIVGFVGDMADSIQWQVRKWKSEKMKHESDESRLILNISAGWEDSLWGRPGAGGAADDPGAMAAPVAAVYHALEFAACEGALVVAAAGNRAWGPESDREDGSAYPAGWADERVMCAADDLRPLVYAASAVGFDPEDPEDPDDGQYVDLVTTRPGARPAFVAYGDHATVRYWQEADRQRLWTTPLTGASIGTVVVAAAAAAVWQENLTLQAEDVMDELWARGADFTDPENPDGEPMAPDSGLRGPDGELKWPHVRVIRVGPGVSAERKERAGAAKSPAGVGISTKLTGLGTSIEDGCGGGPVDIQDWDWADPVYIDDCGDAKVVRLKLNGALPDAEPEEICPHEVLQRMNAGFGNVETEPPSPPCGGCMGGSVYIEIDRTIPERLWRGFYDWRAPTPGEPSPPVDLQVCLKDVAVQVGDTIYSLGLDLGPGDRVRIPTGNGFSIGTGDHAFLAGAFYVDADDEPGFEPDDLAGASISPIFTGYLFSGGTSD